jgi:hypothetical protein
MEGGAGSALASLAVAQINPLGFASDDRPQRSAMAFCRSFHRFCPRALTQLIMHENSATPAMFRAEEDSVCSLYLTV